MADRPLILLTNDDGVDAPGLRAAADALAGVGEVVVVAPDR
ncbi:MAG: 5'/3'-nucleotidase SurE, partial [candidate division NC10 bacterium]